MKFLILIQILLALIPLSFALSLGRGFYTLCNNAECSSLKLSPMDAIPTDQTLQKRSPIPIPQSTAPPAPPTPTVNSTNVTTVYASNGNFQFDITCIAPSAASSRWPQYCNDVQSVYKAVGEELGLILELKSPLTFKATLRSFCNSPNDPSLAGLQDKCDRIIGYGKPSAFFQMNSASGLLPDVMYPQALVKQILAGQSGSNAVGLQPYDCEMEFNTDIPFYFDSTGDQNLTIASNEYDLHYIIAHEAMHALGMVTFFDTNLQQVYAQLAQTNPDAVSTGYNPSKLLSPPVDPQAAEFYKVSIYDYYITSPPLGRWSSQLSLLDTLLDTTSSDSQKKQALDFAAAMYSSATAPGSSYFTFPNGLFDGGFNALSDYETSSDVSAKLNTQSPVFATGTSLVHFDSKDASTSQDFLMRGTAPVGVSLQDLINMYHPVSGPYGEESVGVLASMGYPMNRKLKADAAMDLQSASLLQFNFDLSSLLVTVSFTIFAFWINM